MAAEQLNAGIITRQARSRPVVYTWAQPGDLFGKITDYFKNQDPGIRVWGMKGNNVIHPARVPYSGINDGVREPVEIYPQIHYVLKAAFYKVYFDRSTGFYVGSNLQDREIEGAVSVTNHDDNRSGQSSIS